MIFTDFLADKAKFTKMVHVTFSEKVECHQYSPTGTHPSNDTNDNRNHAEVASSSARGQARVKYDRRFLKSLRKSPISQVCPEFVKKGIEENKSWTGSDPLPIPSGRAISKGNTFYRQPNNYISSNYFCLPFASSVLFNKLFSFRTAATSIRSVLHQ